MFQNSALPSVSVDISQTIAGSLPRLRAWQGLARLDQLLPLPRSFREYLVWLVMMAGVTALALLQLSVTLHISQVEADAQLLKRQYIHIEQQNAELLWQISHFTTLERVQSEAVAAGFVPALNRRYVAADPSVSVSPTSSPEVVAVAAARSQAETGIAPVTAGAETGGLDETALPNLWDDLALVWIEKTQALSSQTNQLRDSLMQQWLKIDLSPYTWIGSPRINNPPR